MTTDQPLARTSLNFVYEIPLFAGLSQTQIDVVAGYLAHRRLAAGQTLFNEWDRADYVCFIESGILEVMKKSGPEKYTPIVQLRRGRSIGEMSLIDNFPRAATVRAKNEAQLVMLYRNRFDLLMTEHPPIGIDILKGLAHLLARNLRKTSSRLADHMLPLG